MINRLFYSFITFFCTLILTLNSSAQNQKNFEADSLLLRNIFDSINISNQQNTWDRSYKLAEKAAKLAAELNDKKREAFAFQEQASALFKKGLTYESLDKYLTSYQIRTEINYKKGIATSLNNIGRVYMNLANYPIALSYFLKGLEVSYELQDTSSLAIIFYNIGVIYYHRYDYEKSLQYLDSAQMYAYKKNLKRIIGNSHKTKGTVYTEQKNFTEALNQYSLALSYLKDGEEVADHSALLNNIGYLFYKQGDYKLALKNHFESLKIKEETNNQRGIANSYHSIGETYLAKGDYSKALHYASLALKESKIFKLTKLEKSSYQLLSDIHFKNGNYKQAYEELKYSYQLKDSISSNETNRKMIEMELNFQFEQKFHQQEMEQKHRESVLLEEARRNRMARNSLTVVILLISILITISTYSYLKIRKDNRELLSQKAEMEMQKEEMETQRDSLATLNAELKQKTEEITAQRDEIEFQRDVVTMQKREITDSIVYAQRIQQAILPSKQTLKKIFPESFILYLPKNVVSGDFYWVSKIGKFRTVAVADCTGHGVPGGFMSMLGIAYLNDIVTKSEINTSGQVLEHMREFIIESLHQTGDPFENFDGMDMSFCAINDDTLEMQFAGANSFAFISRNTENKDEQFIEVLTGDRMPVSRHIKMEPFTNTRVQLVPGDTIYLFTDGYHDQFGGQEGRKYNMRRFRNLFEAVKELPMQKQLEIIENTFIKWKGNQYQIDDVLVMGIKV
ncbi:MAG TPA: tetratricopeptide repeat protein [Tenuifilaceae bacterium]|nr:tetratricopeptide repeat protein [Tenuifilaceae bacterium]HPE18990.1 tetratricopeptide repeat protein [Tenuifilaceae bacterium]HPJ44625.1 tetratricopeptide repeat protein [Tenuifilaceae bacterium]HRX69293.1 tetratricopeptide repeat protein [Tenuifilaceae bacterium]